MRLALPHDRDPGFKSRHVAFMRMHGDRAGTRLNTTPQRGSSSLKKMKRVGGGQVQVTWA